MEGHLFSIWNFQYTWQHRCLRALYAGPCACWASTGPPASHFHCTNHNIWRFAPKLLLSADLFEEPECLPIVIPAKVVVGKVTLANQVPLMVLPMGTFGESTHGPWKDWVLEELNLQGLEEWPKKEQDQARKLLVKWEHLFAHSNLDLGKMSLIKHWIELTDWTPFKEFYWQIPPCRMMWRSISRQCWTLVPSRSCTVHGPVHSFWWKRRTGPRGFVLTSGNSTIRLPRMLTCYPTLRRPNFNWSCWLGESYERVSWWGQLLRSQANVWPDVWPFLLVLNGYTGKRTHQEVLPVHHLQGEATAGSHGEYHGNPSPGTSAHPLPVPEAREG